MKRFLCTKRIAEILTDELAVVNLANTSNEWNAARPYEGNLYAVGMGMVIPYSIGMALQLPQRRVIAVDGDGGSLFDMSVFGIIRQTAPANLCVLIYDNEGYVSTGKMCATKSLTAGVVDLSAVAKASGLENVYKTDIEDDVADIIKRWQNGSLSGPVVIVAKADDSQAFTGTISIDGPENKYRFVRHIEDTERKQILRPSAHEHGKPLPERTSLSLDSSAGWAETLYQSIKSAGVDFVTGLPCSGMSKAQEKCINDPEMKYIAVSNEGTAFGICAGAWLCGARPAALIENYGIFAGAYQLLRGNYHYGIPLLIVAEHRGDLGDTEHWAKAGELTVPILQGMRIHTAVIRDMSDIPKAIQDAEDWMAFGLQPYVVLPAFDLTKSKS